MALSTEVLAIRDRKRQILSAPIEERFMKEAIKQAKKAAAIGEVPIGCVIVREGKILSRGYNRRNTDKTVLAHAEISAIKKACKKLNDFRLEDCVMYVTLEPCQMCAGAIVQARIPRLIYGCKSEKSGSAGTIINVLNIPRFNHQVQIDSGLLEGDCATLLTDFFKNMRKTR